MRCRQPEDVKAVYKVSPFDKKFSVMFAFCDTLELFKARGEILIKGLTFAIMSMTEQIESSHTLATYLL